MKKINRLILIATGIMSFSYIAFALISYTTTILNDSQIVSMWN